MLHDQVGWKHASLRNYLKKYRTWESGLASSYTNWGTDEPNGAGDEDCAEFFNDQWMAGFFDYGEWNDAHCDPAECLLCSGGEHAYLCELR